MTDVHIHDSYLRIDPLLWVIFAGAAGLVVAFVAVSLFARNRRRKP